MELLGGAHDIERALLAVGELLEAAGENKEPFPKAVDDMVTYVRSNRDSANR
jgi:hypothetical protein